MRIVGATILAFVIQLSALGQGCSDAGFCTIPSFSIDTVSNYPFQIELKGSLEGSEPGALIISPQLWFSYQVNDAVQLSAKIPYWLVNDSELGSVSAFNDPIISASFRLFATETYTIKGTAGFRIGIGNADVQGTNMTDLPMDYQNSLGTTDLILGASAQFEGVSVSLAAQLPIWQYNENQDVVFSYLNNQDIDSTKLRYNRKADIMLRLDKSWQFGNWGVKAGVLPIFHLADDELLSTENTGYVTIDGSAGLTLNIPFGVWYQADQWVFGVDGGFPVVTREERPDGLTRRFVLQPRVAYNF